MDGIRYLITMLLNIAIGIISFFLGLRIILQLLGANPLTPFVTWIYNVSEGLMTPFRGIFPSATITNNSIFDVAGFVALVVYALIFYFIISLINILFQSVEGRTTRRVITEDEVNR